MDKGEVNQTLGTLQTIRPVTGPLEVPMITSLIHAGHDPITNSLSACFEINLLSTYPWSKQS